MNQMLKADDGNANLFGWILGEIDALILDQTYGEGHNAGDHLDAGKLKNMIRKLRNMGAVTDTTLIYATHISHEGNHTHRKMQSLAQRHGYDFAYDGLVIDV
jgi:phosphoribosyl 1,2-cyclic phosphate phosphodiesterase